MNDEKEKKGFWQSWMTIAILLTLTIMVIIFNSQGPSIRSEQNENIPIGNVINIPPGHDNITGRNITDGDTNITVRGTNITGNNIAIMDNDTYFRKMVEVNLGEIYFNLKCISRAGQTQNFSETERCARFLSENSNLSLRHANDYNVSSSIQNAVREYKNALEYYNIGGTKLAIGARNRNASQMNDAVEDIQNGTAHVDKTTLILFGNGSFAKVSNATYTS